MKWVLLVVTEHLKHNGLSPDVVYEGFGYCNSDLVAKERKENIDNR